jgi:ADP-ribose pyrophosphatase YjhB (NUDIX family)
VADFKNPIPVVVGIVLTKDDEVLIIKRAIEPFIGGWALPSGYVEEGDNWRDRLRQEIEDEACVVVSTEHKHMRLYEARTTPNGKILLLFAVITRDGIRQMKPFIANDEVSERKSVSLNLYSCPSLCFNLHEEVLRQHRDENWTHERQHVGGW